LQALVTSSICGCCASSDTKLVLKLVDTPMEDHFLTKPNFQPVYPLELLLCLSCSFAFLSHRINPSLSYSEYTYKTNLTIGLASHYQDYVSTLVKKLNLTEKSFVIDIGSNDGTMVASLQAARLNAIGVEPAGAIAKIANDAGRPTINEYFSKNLGHRLVGEMGKAKLITANYMFANIPDLDDFLEGVTTLLDDTGMFVVQTGYHPDQFKNKMFDYIYHEHFSYFTIKSLKALFNRHGLVIVDVERQSPKGGSVRVTAAKKKAVNGTSGRVNEFISEENIQGWSGPEPFNALWTSLSERRLELRTQLERFRNEGRLIGGFGASHSTTTLMYNFGLSDFITSIFDDNEMKHGTFSPGHHIPVYPTDDLARIAPDVLVLLAWQHQASILHRHQSYLERGLFVIPLPNLRFVGRGVG
jgi:hypothetical protein